MRILSFLFKSFIVLTILGVAGFFIGRELLLYSGTAQLRNATVQLRQVAQNRSPYIVECQKRGATDLTVDVIEKIQLRFSDSRAYSVEVLCRHLSLDPIIVSEHTLPLFVTKVPGTSGLVWDSGMNAVGLELWGRTKTFVLEGTDFSSTNAEANVLLASGPITTCEGYGYSCCGSESAEGVGNQITIAQDCPRTCYQQCVSRPVVLSFSTDPYFDITTRLLEISPEQEVTFSYVADFGGSTKATVIIDFGDGNQQEFDTTQGTTTHAYSCTKRGCQYSAQLKIVNNEKVESVPTTISQVQINVL